MKNNFFLFILLCIVIAAMLAFSLTRQDMYRLTKQEQAVVELMRKSDHRSIQTFEDGNWFVTGCEIGAPCYTDR